MQEPPDDIRQEIARLARRKDSRIVPRSHEMPCDWRPHSVNNPHTDMPFTDAGAWELIAELAESGQPMHEVILEQPAGDIGHEFNVRLAPTEPQLYIKVQVKRSKLWGRSFHYSYKVD